MQREQYKNAFIIYKKKCLIRLFLAQINLMNQEVEIHNTRMMCQDVM